MKSTREEEQFRRSIGKEIVRQKGGGERAGGGWEGGGGGGGETAGDAEAESQREEMTERDAL